MPDFTKRSNQKELLDEGGIPFADIQQNMKELNTINTLLGGHSITICGIREILTKHKLITFSEPLLVCEIGCGGGDNILALQKWCKKNNIAVRFIGIDIKKECIDFAKIQCAAVEADWIVSSYESVEFTAKPDIIFSSLFCHHFTDTELISMLQWKKQNCTIGFFINDLQRNRIAYFLIKWITRLFSRSYLVKNDAPISVARGFKRHDWLKLITAATLVPCSIQWKWAFRYLIRYQK